MTPDLRKRLFTAQQRMAITSSEALAIFGFVTLMAVGSVVSHLEARRPRVDPAAYVALDAAIEAGARSSVEEAHASLPEGPTTSIEVQEPAAQTRSASRQTLAPARLDPNTASSQALQRLPGIGPALAGRIIEYRELQGPFRSPRDLLAVKGIGPKTFERLEPYLFVSTQPVASQSPVEPGAASSESSAAPSPP
jgi:competence ComEA-like helix-hairpin-helix protein